MKNSNTKESSEQSSGRHVKLELAATIAMLIAAALLIPVLCLTIVRATPVAGIFGLSQDPRVVRANVGSARAGAQTIPTEPISVEGSALKGSTTAKLVMIEYSEFQCPYCARFVQDTWPELVRDYVETGRIQVAFKHLPLESVHPWALTAATAAECARQQGTFWPVHDIFFAKQASLNNDKVVQEVTPFIPDTRPFSACMQDAGRRAVLADLKDASTIGIVSTPTFLVGTRLDDGRVKITHRIAGARPVNDFRRVLDGALEAANETK